MDNQALPEKSFFKKANPGTELSHPGIPANLLPLWDEDELATECADCGKGFGKGISKGETFVLTQLLSSRHHCRCCGMIFCADCSPSRAPIPHIGYDKPVRICLKCQQLLADGDPGGRAGAAWGLRRHGKPVLVRVDKGTPLPEADPKLGRVATEELEEAALKYLNAQETARRLDLQEVWIHAIPTDPWYYPPTGGRTLRFTAVALRTVSTGWGKNSLRKYELILAQGEPDVDESGPGVFSAHSIRSSGPHSPFDLPPDAHKTVKDLFPTKESYLSVPDRPRASMTAT